MARLPEDVCLAAGALPFGPVCGQLHGSTSNLEGHERCHGRTTASCAHERRCAKSGGDEHGLGERLDRHSDHFEGWIPFSRSTRGNWNFPRRLDRNGLQSGGFGLVWDVDGLDLKEHEHGFVQDDPFRSGDSLVRDQFRGDDFDATCAVAENNQWQHCGGIEFHALIPPDHFGRLNRPLSHERYLFHCLVPAEFVLRAWAPGCAAFVASAVNRAASATPSRATVSPGRGAGAGQNSLSLLRQHCFFIMEEQQSYE